MNFLASSAFWNIQLLLLPAAAGRGGSSVVRPVRWHTLVADHRQAGFLKHDPFVSPKLTVNTGSAVGDPRPDGHRETRAQYRGRVDNRQAIGSWLSGPRAAAEEMGADFGYRGERLGLPEDGPGSIARSGGAFGAALHRLGAVRADRIRAARGR